jgi:hypothetical protein
MCSASDLLTVSRAGAGCPCIRGVCPCIQKDVFLSSPQFNYTNVHRSSFMKRKISCQVPKKKSIVHD